MDMDKWDRQPDEVRIDSIERGIKDSVWVKTNTPYTEHGRKPNGVGGLAEVQKARKSQVGGDHYINMGVQPWDAMEAWMTTQEFKGFLRGNAIKYLARSNCKGGLEDIKKAKHYLTKLIEVMENTA